MTIKEEFKTIWRILSNVLVIVLLVFLILMYFNNKAISELNEDLKTRNNNQADLIDDMTILTEAYNELIPVHEALIREYQDYRDNALKREALKEHNLTEAEILMYLREIPTGRVFNGITYKSAGYGESLGKGGMWRPFHKGFDCWAIDPVIYPIGEGTSIKCDIDDIYGKYVVIQHTPRVRSRYGHAEKIFYEAMEGRVVTVDTKLMIMGETGYSDGKHLHLEIEIRLSCGTWVTVDPEPWVIRV